MIDSDSQSLCAKLQKLFLGHTESNSPMANVVEITRNPAQKEKPKPNWDIRSIFTEMTKSKHKNYGKQMKDMTKTGYHCRLVLLLSATLH